MQQRLIQTEDVPSHDMMAAEDETLDLLPEEFSPGKWDVICQRGKECYDHGKLHLAKTCTNREEINISHSIISGIISCFSFTQSATVDSE